MFIVDVHASNEIYFICKSIMPKNQHQIKKNRPEFYILFLFSFLNKFLPLLNKLWSTFCDKSKMNLKLNKIFFFLILE